MGLLDIDEVKEISKEYFEYNKKWICTYSSGHLTTFKKAIGVYAQLFSGNPYKQSIGYLHFKFHFQRNNTELQIYFIPKVYTFLGFEERMKYQKCIEYISNFLKPYFLIKSVKDELTLEQITDGICATLSENNFEIVNDISKEYMMIY